MQDLVREFSSSCVVVPIIIVIDDADEHRKRFASRKADKYTAYFQNIRTIQRYIISFARSVRSIIF